MSSSALDIGLEIKILRERLQVSSKDLAQKVGLSQSQMSRLEKGQRRIDTRILQRIAEALGVDPAFFFRGGETAASATPAKVESVDSAAPPARPITYAPAIPFDHLGKLIRSERRKRHMTVDDLAAKVSRTKAYVAALEEGKHPLDAELGDKICRALKLSPQFFVAAQQEWIGALQAQVARLDQALAEAHRGRIESANGDDHAGNESPRRKIPLYGSLAINGSVVFDATGQPAGEPEDFVQVPGFEASGAFAFTVAGDAMESTGQPSFREGDVVVFAPTGLPRSRELALLRLRNDTLLFRQIFIESDGSLRLQPLNLLYPSQTFSRQQILGSWPLALHIARV